MTTSADEVDSTHVAQDRGSTARGVLWTASTLSLIFVALRCYTRLWVRRIFGVDDGLVAVATLLLIAYAAVINVGTGYGLGQHTDVILATKPENLETVTLFDIISQPLVLTSCALGKAAFAVTLLRLGVQTWMRVSLWIVIVSINLLHFLISIFMFMRCEDPRAVWMQDVDSKCWHPNAFMVFTVVIVAYSAFVDFYLALVPWYLIWGLHGMKKAQKLGVAIAMSLGMFAGAVAVVKATYLPKYSGPEDFSYTHMELIWWAGVENALILIAASIPTLRPLLTAITGTFTGSGRSKYTSNENYELQSPAGRSLSRAGTRKSRAQWSVADGVEAAGDEASDHHSDRAILGETSRGEVSSLPLHSHSGDESFERGISVQRDFSVQISYHE